MYLIVNDKNRIVLSMQNNVTVLIVHDYFDRLWNCHHKSENPLIISIAIIHELFLILHLRLAEKIT